MVSSKNKQVGTVMVRVGVIQKRCSFIQYIRGGCQMNLMLAIDYTGSNKAPS